MLADFYDLSLQLRGGVFGILLTGGLAWVNAKTVPMYVMLLTMAQAFVFLSVSLAGILWLTS